MRLFPLALATVLFLTYAPLRATCQATTSTNCNTYGTMTNCTSTTTDNAAQQQRAYEAGQQVGNALGQGIAMAMQAHSFRRGVKKYCLAHPGEEWHYGNRSTGVVISSGYCPSDEDKIDLAANEFILKHRDYIPNPSNSAALSAYIETNRLNPREEKSYEKGYKVLKADRRLQLYAK